MNGESTENASQHEANNGPVAVFLEAEVAARVLLAYYPARSWAVWVEHDHRGEFRMVATVITSAVDGPLHQQERVFSDHGTDGRAVAREVIVKADDRIGSVALRIGELEAELRRLKGGGQ